jgi:hypothetical protein
MVFMSRERDKIRNEIRYNTIDQKNEPFACPVCGKLGRRMDSGEIKHLERITLSPKKKIVRSVYCYPQKAGA